MGHGLGWMLTEQAIREAVLGGRVCAVCTAGSWAFNSYAPSFTGLGGEWGEQGHLQMSEIATTSDGRKASSRRQ